MRVRHPDSLVLHGTGWQHNGNHVSNSALGRGGSLLFAPLVGFETNIRFASFRFPPLPAFSSSV